MLILLLPCPLQLLTANLQLFNKCGVMLNSELH